MALRARKNAIALSRGLAGALVQAPPRTQISRSVTEAITWPDQVWHLFTSPKLALILILILASASFAGVMLAQAPEGARVDQTAYARWLEQVRPKYGAATDILNALGLLRIFSAWWFQTLLALLAANILVCSVNRAGRILKGALAQPRVVLPPSFFQRAKLRASVGLQGLTFEEAAELLRKSLRRSGYRVLLQKQAGQAHVFADRNRFAPAGTLVHHLSLVALLLGFVIGGRWGVVDPAFVVSEGATRAIGTTGLAVQLDTFVDEYFPEGPPKDYRSHVRLFDQGRQVREADVRVNSPLLYKGTRLHQSFFGPAAVVEVHEQTGTTLFSEAVPLAWQSQERPVGSFSIPGSGLEVYVVGPASAFIDPVIPPGQVRFEVYRVGSGTPFVMGNAVQGQSVALGNLTYSFVRERQFSGFAVVQDPSRPLLWAAAIGIVVGLMWTFYFPHRQLWAMCERLADGTCVVRLGAAQGKWGEFVGEFKSIARRIEKTAVRAGGEARAELQEVA